MGCAVGGECIAQPAGVRRGCVGERKCSARACRCAGARRSLRRGRCCEVGGECIAQPAGVRRDCVGERKCSARACRCAGARRSLRRGRCCEVGGECIAQPAGVHRRCVGVRRRCVGERKCSGRACRCAWASGGLWRGMGGEVGGFNAHSPQQHARTCIIIYTSALSTPSNRGHGAERRPLRVPIPAKASAPAPSAFAFSYPRSHFPRIAFGLPPNDFRTHPVRVCTFVPAFTLPPHRLPRPPRSNRPPAAAVIHNGLSTEKLSTSLPAALCKTCSPSRLRTRIYNISFARRPLPGSVRAAPEKSPRRCGTVSRAAVRRVGEGEGKGGRPLAQCRTMPLVCRITVRKGGSAQGQPRPCPCVLPAAACLRPRPCPLMGELPCAKAEVHKANPAPARAFSPRQLVYRRAPAR